MFLDFAIFKPFSYHIYFNNVIIAGQCQFMSGLTENKPKYDFLFTQNNVKIISQS